MRWQYTRKTIRFLKKRRVLHVLLNKNRIKMWSATPWLPRIVETFKYIIKSPGCLCFFWITNKVVITQIELRLSKICFFLPAFGSPVVQTTEASTTTTGKLFFVVVENKTYTFFPCLVLRFANPSVIVISRKVVVS